MGNGEFPGRVIFLALGGMAFWINYYFNKRRPPRKSTTCLCGKTQLPKHCFIRQVKAQVHDGEVDYLSELPDDVLSFILSKLTVRDAARTSILSTRWKNLFASMPVLRFGCLTMFGIPPRYHSGLCPCYQEQLLKGINQLLQLYSGRRVTHIAMTFCLRREFSSEFNHWLRSISKLGVESLFLSLRCCFSMPFQDFGKLLRFSLEPLSQASSMKHLVLNYCILLSSPKVHFNSLVTLTMRGVVLESGHLEHILSCCLNLKQLTLVDGRLPYKLQLASTVTSIIFCNCDGVKEIDLWAANLRTFTCCIFGNFRIFFSSAPMLEYVSITLLGASSVSYIFGDFARDLPAQVKSLTIEAYPEVGCFPTEMKTFKNLRQLKLELKYLYCDMVNLAPLLAACPLLRLLSLVAVHRDQPRDERKIRTHPSSPTCHTELLEVTLHGICGTESEIELVLYILRSSIVLERMFLSRGYSYFHKLGIFSYTSDVPFDQRKRKLIQEKLFGQAISKKAVVIIQ